MALENSNKLHSVESAAALLGGVSVSLIRKWLSTGVLTRVKIGRLVRIREHEVLARIDKPGTVYDRRTGVPKGGI